MCAFCRLDKFSDRKIQRIFEKRHAGNNFDAGQMESDAVSARLPFCELLVGIVYIYFNADTAVFLYIPPEEAHDQGF